MDAGASPTPEFPHPLAHATTSAIHVYRDEHRILRQVRKLNIRRHSRSNLRLRISSLDSQLVLLKPAVTTLVKV
jgi:hypothetical protein